MSYQMHHAIGVEMQMKFGKFAITVVETTPGMCEVTINVKAMEQFLDGWICGRLAGHKELVEYIADRDR